MKNFLLAMIAIVAACPAVVRGQVDINDAEIYRRGDMIQFTGVVRDSGDEEFAAALAPPESDADKWFISIVCTEGCAPCERLKADFASSEFLRGWHAEPVDPQGKRVHGWAHVSVFKIEDDRTKWRFENAKIKAFPAVIVQPPANGTWGKNETIAVQLEGYDGDPKKFSALLRSKLKQYVDAMQKKRVAKANYSSVGIGQKVTIPPGPDPTMPQDAAFEDYFNVIPESMADVPWVASMRKQGIPPKTAKLIWDAEHKAPAPPEGFQPASPAPAPTKSDLKPTSVTPTVTPTVNPAAVPPQPEATPSRSSMLLTAALVIGGGGLIFVFALCVIGIVLLRRSRTASIISAPLKKPSLPFELTDDEQIDVLVRRRQKQMS